jgi:hypothetical protein
LFLLGRNNSSFRADGERVEDLCVSQITAGSE